MTCDERRAPKPKPVHLDELRSHARAVRANANWYRSAAADAPVTEDDDQW